MKKSFISIMTLTLFLTGVGLSAEPNDKKPGQKPSQQSMMSSPDQKGGPGKNGKPQIDLSDTEISSIEKAVKAKAPVMDQARAELEVIRAQIQRELVNKEVNLSKVRELVKSSLAQEETLRMSEIEIQIQIRQIVGEDKWVQISKFMRMNQDGPMGGQGPDKEDRLLNILNKMRK